MVGIHPLVGHEIDRGYLKFSLAPPPLPETLLFCTKCPLGVAHNGIVAPP